jgi:hypothetical protein
VNWKSSLFGALLVAAAGLVVGVVVGGKTTTRTDTSTITVASTVSRTVTVTTPPTSTGGTTNGGSTTPAPNGSPGPTQNNNQQYYSDYLGTQDTGQLDGEATNVGLDSNAATLELKGQTYPHAVAFDLGSNNSYRAVPESFQLPVPGFTSFSSGLTGLDTNASHKASYKLTVYKDNDNPGATVLYTATFNGPSDTHPMKFKTQGATDLIFDWTEPPSGEPDSSDQFIIANPIVTTS